MKKISNFLKKSHEFVVQYDFHRYMENNPIHKIKQNEEFAKNPIEAESVDEVKSVLKSRNKNPFYFVIIPKEKFTAGIVDRPDHPYVKFNR